MTDQASQQTAVSEPMTLADHISLSPLLSAMSERDQRVVYGVLHAKFAQQAVGSGPERCPTCGVRHRAVAVDSPFVKAHQAAVESDLTNDQILAMLPQIGAILPNIDSGKVELRPVEYRDALRSYAIRAIRALKSRQPAQADKDKP